MGKGTVAVLLLGALFAICVEARAASSPLDKEIDAQLRLLNKPAVKTIQSEDGDIIDCVDVYKQPAFDLPALKNHTIQMVPNFLRESQINSSTRNTEHVYFQTWQRSGTCPNGTIPIRRIKKEDLLRVKAASLERFGMIPSPQFNNSTKTTNGSGNNLHNFVNINVNGSGTTNPIPLDILPNRVAAYLLAVGYNYIGAQADINVWNPNVDLPDDFTTAQIWLKATNGPYFESIEAGWMVNPTLYGDRKTRLFAHWTVDSYKSTGCFDLTCSGFVQTGTQVALGAAIGPVSSRGGQQYEINVGIFQDPSSGNWWLKVKDNVPIGYWPSSVLGNLKHSATAVQWGGQVFSTGIRRKPHTATTMGSGGFADALFGNACFMQNVRIKDYSLQLKYPESVSAMAEEPYCYSAYNYVKYGVEPVFYFGGPGRRPPYCP